jgi:hypothetical protein
MTDNRCSNIRTSIFDGFGFYRNNKINKKYSYQDILDEYNTCVQGILPNENIDKCKHIIELYKECIVFHKINQDNINN